VAASALLIVGVEMFTV